MNKSDVIKLNMLGLPAMQTIDDLSKITHLSKYTIYQLSKNADKYYFTYSIPKKNGRLRMISQPNKKLKGLQSWILVNILNKIKVSESCKGFEKGSSISDNVEPHVGANTILSMDIQDFFPSIKRNKIFNIFEAIGYNSIITTILTNICTFNGSLPQGGPCSPKLANLTAWMLDMRIQGYVGKRGINYTRYADDLTFSGLHPSKILNIIPVIKLIIQDEKFAINHSKTRITGSARAKKVTGLIISNTTFGIGAYKYKEIRSKINHLALEEEQKNIKLLNEVQGWLAYINGVDSKRAIKARAYALSLSEKYPGTLLEKIVK